MNEESLMECTNGSMKLSTKLLFTLSLSHIVLLLFYIYSILLYLDR